VAPETGEGLPEGAEVRLEMETGWEDEAFPGWFIVDSASAVTLTSVLLGEEAGEEPGAEAVEALAEVLRHAMSAASSAAGQALGFSVHLGLPGGEAEGEPEGEHVRLRFDWRFGDDGSGAFTALIPRPAMKAGVARMAEAADGGLDRQDDDVGREVVVQPARFKPLEERRGRAERRNIDFLIDVPLEMTVELGRTRRRIGEILELGPGSVLQLEKFAGEAVDLLINGRPIARGEVVVIDESFGVRITDILSPEERVNSLR